MLKQMGRDVVEGGRVLGSATSLLCILGHLMNSKGPGPRKAPH